MFGYCYMIKHAWTLESKKEAKHRTTFSLKQEITEDQM